MRPMTLGSSILLAPLVIALFTSVPASGQEGVHAFQGAEIIPIAQEPIDEGVLVVRDGRIEGVGPQGEVSIPEDARIHDASGKVIMPGLVDTHSHAGGGDGGDGSAPIHGAVRILDALDVRDEGLARARAGGVTTKNIMPGSGHLMSGQTAYVKLRDGRTIYDLLFCDDPLEEVCGGVKMANGTNPLASPPFPESRAKSAALVRQRFVEAREQLGGGGQPGARDLEMEALREVLDGERVVHFHTHRHDDVLTVLRLQREFGFRVVLHHVSDAWIVADEISGAEVPASIILVDAPGGKEEALETSFRSGAALEEAGALVGFHTDDPITDSRFFLRQAAMAVRAGMSREGALEALTLAGARMMDLEDRIGSLEEGKDADFIVLSGDPLSAYTVVEETWIDGRRLFDRSDPGDRMHAVGGDPGPDTGPGDEGRTDREGGR